MASSAVQNPTPVTGESKSARKKKAKAEAAGGTGTPPVPAVPDAPGKENSSTDGKGDGEAAEHPYIKELAKQIRNIHKKLTGMQKLDAIVSENPNTSLDDLVVQRKINADQKNAITKKPQLQSQVAALEDQILQYRKFDFDYQSQMQKQKDDLTSQHQKEMEKAREDFKFEGVSAGAAELRKKLLIFSQFLRCAAAKRTVEEEADTVESRAFEGALLLVYGGDQKAVETALALIEGSDEQVMSIEGVELPFKYAQIHQASIEHAPFQAEENWVDSVAEASAAGAETTEPIPVDSDPTIAHAGLTELDTSGNANGMSGDAHDSITSPPQGDAGNSAGNEAGDRWDTTAPGGEKGLMEESYEMVPRPQDELENPASAANQPDKSSWADEPPAYETAASGNQAGESWDLKPAGDQTDNAWGGGDAAAPLTTNGWADGAANAAPGAEQTDADGFHPVAGRHRGRGSRGRGEGDFRSRSRGRGGFRGDGEFRGRGRGGFRGPRGDGGEFRGRGGRGRGPPRGTGSGQTHDV